MWTTTRQQLCEQLEDKQNGIETRLVHFMAEIMDGLPAGFNFTPDTHTLTHTYTHAHTQHCRHQTGKRGKRRDRR